MSNALFAFEACEAGNRAAEDLRQNGFDSDAVKVYHQKAHDGASRQLDEQVTGGLVSNLLDLFQGVFDWGGSPHNAAAYEDTVRRGGAVVSVNANTSDEMSIADQRMQAAGCRQRTTWQPENT